MPWTFAHPAAVLPLRRLCGPGRLSFAALVVGALSPDFCYYVGRFDAGAFTHTPLGVLLACVPAGWLVLWVAQRLRDPVADLLPEPHRSTVHSPSAVSPPPTDALAAAMTVLSLALGAATHVAWDAFTHEGQFFVQHFPVLRTPLSTLFGVQFRLYGILQYASSLLGVAVLMHAYVAHVRRSVHTARVDVAADRRRVRRLCGLAALSLLAGASVVCGEAYAGVFGVNPFRSLVRFATWSATCFFTLLAGVALHDARTGARASRQAAD